MWEFFDAQTSLFQISFARNYPDLYFANLYNRDFTCSIRKYLLEWNSLYSTLHQKLVEVNS